MAGDRYQTFRSISDLHVFALCRDVEGPNRCSEALY
jgi:hypothetical protein